LTEQQYVEQYLFSHSPSPPRLFVVLTSHAFASPVAASFITFGS